MFAKRLIFTFLIYIFTQSICFSQQKNIEADAETHSLQLFNNANWEELLQYGKETIKNGTDFSLLRMRMGYAAFMMGNYSQSFKYYKAVYTAEPNNNTALYYCYLNNLYLNNTAATRFYASKLDEYTKNIEHLKPIKISEIGLEYSFKAPNITERGNAQYALLNINTQVGYKLELQQGFASYNQIINEPKFIYVTDNNKINISQKEYFAKLIYTPIAKLNIIGGFHYVYTPFNNFKYGNNIAFGGVKFATPYIHLQGLAHIANVTDIKYNQFDVAINTYPTGNLNLYTISKAMFGNNTVFKQVLGTKVMKNTWLEGNITLGEYETLIDNDGLYLVNDIDTKKFKAGASIYTFLHKKFLLSLNYNLEQKQKYQTTNNNFNQHSSTINLKWNL
jgi:hypothetical protein